MRVLPPSLYDPDGSCLALTRHQIKSRIEIRIAVSAVQTGGAKGGVRERGREGGRREKGGRREGVCLSTVRSDV